MAASASVSTSRAVPLTEVTGRAGIERGWGFFVRGIRFFSLRQHSRLKSVETPNADPFVIIDPRIDREQENIRATRNEVAPFECGVLHTLGESVWLSEYGTAYDGGNEPSVCRAKAPGSDEFVLAYAERPARVLTNNPLRRERRGRIASGMGERGVGKFRGFSSGTGRGTTLTDAKSDFLLCGPSDRRAGLVALSSLLFRTSVLAKGASTSCRTGPETAIKMRLFLGSGVPNSSIHICLFERCDARVNVRNEQGSGQRAEDGGRRAGSDKSFYD